MGETADAMIDLSGQVFGKLTALKEVGSGFTHCGCAVAIALK